jgi:hypothetical protein
MVLGGFSRLRELVGVRQWFLPGLFGRCFSKPQRCPLERRRIAVECRNGNKFDGHQSGVAKWFGH